MPQRLGERLDLGCQGLTHLFCFVSIRQMNEHRVALALAGVIELVLAVVSANVGDLNVWVLVASLTSFFTCAISAWMWRQQVRDARDHEGPD
jgi:hypothetical protein